MHISAGSTAATDVHIAPPVENTSPGDSASIKDTSAEVRGGRGDYDAPNKFGMEGDGDRQHDGSNLDEKAKELVHDHPTQKVRLGKPQQLDARSYVGNCPFSFSASTQRHCATALVRVVSPLSLSLAPYPLGRYIVSPYKIHCVNLALGSLLEM